MPLPDELARGTITPIVLSLLADQSMYGYEIAKTVNARSNGVLTCKEGTLYPILHKLQGQRLIKARWETATSGKKRKYYRLTPKGQRFLSQSQKDWQAVSTAVNAFLAGA